MFLGQLSDPFTPHTLAAPESSCKDYWAASWKSPTSSFSPGGLFAGQVPTDMVVACLFVIEPLTLDWPTRPAVIWRTGNRLRTPKKHEQEYDSQRTSSLFVEAATLEDCR